MKKAIVFAILFPSISSFAGKSDVSCSKVKDVQIQSVGQGTGIHIRFPEVVLEGAAYPVVDSEIPEKSQLYQKAVEAQDTGKQLCFDRGVYFTR